MFSLSLLVSCFFLCCVYVFFSSFLSFFVTLVCGAILTALVFVVFAFHVFLFCRFCCLSLQQSRGATMPALLNLTTRLCRLSVVSGHVCVLL